MAGRAMISYRLAAMQLDWSVFGRLGVVQACCTVVLLVCAVVLWQIATDRRGGTATLGSAKALAKAVDKRKLQRSRGVATPALEPAPEPPSLAPAAKVEFASTPQDHGGATEPTPYERRRAASRAGPAELAMLPPWAHNAYESPGPRSRPLRAGAKKHGTGVDWSSSPYESTPSTRGCCGGRPNSPPNLRRKATRPLYRAPPPMVRQRQGQQERGAPSRAKGRPQRAPDSSSGAPGEPEVRTLGAEDLRPRSTWGTESARCESARSLKPLEGWPATDPLMPLLDA